MNLSKCFLLPLLAAVAIPAGAAAQAQEDPLPSWNDGDAKTAIVEFVETVTDESSDNFVPAPERIATFDNDGTLWTELAFTSKRSEPPRRLGGAELAAKGLPADASIPIPMRL